jgi:hypothetical protein
MIMQPTRLAICCLGAMFLSACGESDESTQSTNTTNITALSSSELTLLVSNTTLSYVEPANGSVDVVINLSLPSIPTTDVSFDYEITPGTAVEGLDYSGIGGNVIFTSGSSTAQLVFTINGDSFDEDAETLSLNLKNPMGMSLGNNTQILVTIIDEDPTPEISFTTSVAQVIEGVGVYDIDVVMSSQSQKDIEIGYNLSGLAVEGQDYKLLGGQNLVIESGELTTSIGIDFIQDNIAESGESLILTLLTPSSGNLGSIHETVVVIQGDVAMNDTGVVTWFDGISYTNTSPNAEYPNQDADFGRDVNEFAPHDGKAGFDFSKLDAAGNVLPSNATNYRCIRDNTAGLVWEKKSENSVFLPQLYGNELREHLLNAFSLASNPEEENYAPYPYTELHRNWRDKNYRYYYFEEDNTVNGGNSGPKGSTFVDSLYPISALCAFPTNDMVSYNPNIKHCNTTEYVEAMNAISYCGFKNWKVPEIKHLQSFHNFSATDNSSDYFINIAQGDYISSTPSADGEGQIWCFDHDKGQVKYCNKSIPNRLRLVREDK